MQFVISHHSSIKMKSIGVFVFLGACALVSASYLTSVPKVADEKFMMQQQVIYELLLHVHQKDLYNKHYEVAKDWDFMKNLEHFNKPEAVKVFWEKYQHGFLAVNEVFDITHWMHWKQAHMVYDLLNATKDWETFYKTMVWLRYNISTEMFVYVLTSVIIHNERFAGFEMPAPYEIQPQFFFNAQTIRKAQRAKMQGFENMKMVDGKFDFTLLTNYTDSKLMLNDEQKLAYFTEDIGMNSWYYYLHQDYPFWMDAANDKTWNDRRGELYLFAHWQLLKRYHMERLSNGLGDIKEFSWDKHLPSGYYPQLTYMNGEKFPARGNYYNMMTPNNMKNIEWIKTYERRLVEAIDRGYAILDDGTHMNITNNIEELAKVSRMQRTHQLFRYTNFSFCSFVHNTIRSSWQHQTLVTPNTTDCSNRWPSVICLPQLKPLTGTTWFQVLCNTTKLPSATQCSTNCTSASSRSSCTGNVCTWPHTPRKS